MKRIHINKDGWIVDLNDDKYPHLLCPLMSFHNGRSVDCRSKCAYFKTKQNGYGGYSAMCGDIILGPLVSEKNKNEQE